MLLQTACHYDQDSELEAALARILGSLRADQILTTSHDCGRTLPEVESARNR